MGIIPLACLGSPPRDAGPTMASDVDLRPLNLEGQLGLRLGALGGGNAD